MPPKAQYIIQFILDHRTAEDNSIEYLTRWSSPTNEPDSWENSDSLNESAVAIYQHHQNKLKQALATATVQQPQQQPQFLNRNYKNTNTISTCYKFTYDSQYLKWLPPIQTQLRLDGLLELTVADNKENQHRGSTRFLLERERTVSFILSYIDINMYSELLLTIQEQDLTPNALFHTDIQHMVSIIEPYTILKALEQISNDPTTLSKRVKSNLSKLVDMEHSTNKIRITDTIFDSPNKDERLPKYLNFVDTLCVSLHMDDKTPTVTEYLEYIFTGINPLPTSFVVIQSNASAYILSNYSQFKTFASTFRYISTIKKQLQMLSKDLVLQQSKPNNYPQSTTTQEGFTFYAGPNITCTRCGSNTHITSACYSTKGKDGKIIILPPNATKPQRSNNNNNNNTLKSSSQHQNGKYSSHQKFNSQQISNSKIPKTPCPHCLSTSGKSLFHWKSECRKLTNISDSNNKSGIPKLPTTVPATLPYAPPAYGYPTASYWTPNYQPPPTYMPTPHHIPHPQIPLPMATYNPVADIPGPQTFYNSEFYLPFDLKTFSFYNDIPNNTLHFDCGSSYHIVNNLKYFTTYLSHPEKLGTVGDSANILGYGTATFQIFLPQFQTYSTLVLNHARYVPSSPTNLVSIGSFTNNHSIFVAANGYANLSTSTGTILAAAIKTNNQLYKIITAPEIPSYTTTTTHSQLQNTSLYSLPTSTPSTHSMVTRSQAKNYPPIIPVPVITSSNEHALQHSTSNNLHDNLPYHQISDPLPPSLDLIFNSLEDKLLFFHKCFGHANSILGLTIEYLHNGIHLNQSKYIDEILEKFNMSKCNGKSTPLPTGIDLQLNKNPNFNKNLYPYAQALGCCNFLSSVSKPTITYATNYLMKFSHGYDNTHWNAVKHLLAYLKTTKDHGIFLPYNMSLELKIFCDASFCNDNTCKSILGYIFYLGKLPYAWISHTLTGIALSSNEAELCALQLATRDSIALIAFLRELISPIIKFYNITPVIPTTIIIQNDNISAIQMTTNDYIHRRSKHILRRILYLRHMVTSNSITFQYISSADNDSDFLTKNQKQILHLQQSSRILISLKDIQNSF